MSIDDATPEEWDALKRQFYRDKFLDDELPSGERNLTEETILSTEEWYDMTRTLLNNYTSSVNPPKTCYTGYRVDTTIYDEHLPEPESSPPPMQRFNTGKPPLSYMLELDKASRGVCRVLEYGAVKYERNNYKNGGAMAAKEFLLDSMLRHAMAYMNGEDLDEESGLPHVYHMACSAMFAAYHYKGEGAEE